MHSDCGRELLSYLKDIFRAIFRIGADAKVRRPLRGRLSSHEALVSCPAACEDSARVSSVAMKLSAGRVSFLCLKQPAISHLVSVAADDARPCGSGC
eukprot:s27_g7.t5